MKKTALRLTGALLVLTATYSQAQETHVCKHGGKERVITVVQENPPSKVPCKVTYQKDGKTEVLWSAKGEVGYCEKNAEAFAAKQATWGWKCHKEILTK